MGNHPSSPFPTDFWKAPTPAGTPPLIRPPPMCSPPRPAPPSSFDAASSLALGCLPRPGRRWRTEDADARRRQVPKHRNQSRAQACQASDAHAFGASDVLCSASLIACVSAGGRSKKPHKECHVNRHCARTNVKGHGPQRPLKLKDS
jgi:hypothetical protein